MGGRQMKEAKRKKNDGHKPTAEKHCSSFHVICHPALPPSFPPSLPLYLRVIPRNHHLHPPEQMLLVMLPLVSHQFRGRGGGNALGEAFGSKEADDLLGAREELFVCGGGRYVR